MAVPLRPDQSYTPPPTPLISRAARRLLWTLQGSLTSAIFVSADDFNPDGPREPYFQQTGAGTSWHPISGEPMTEQPVLSLTVTEEDLDGWQEEWRAINQEGFDDDVQPAPGAEPPKFAPLVVRASSGDFVTVYDFVSAVHPWLMERRAEILQATNVADEDYTPSGDERLLVSAFKPENVSAEDEDEWMGMLRWVYEQIRHQQQQRGQTSTD